MELPVDSVNYSFVFRTSENRSMGDYFSFFPSQGWRNLQLVNVVWGLVKNCRLKWLLLKST